jgi:hypothetical protein
MASTVGKDIAILFRSEPCFNVGRSDSTRIGGGAASRRSSYVISGTNGSDPSAMVESTGCVCRAAELIAEAA